ncbi:hypothetical protein GCM10022237_42550 [Nocardioides ginsengisoli]
MVVGGVLAAQEGSAREVERQPLEAEDVAVERDAALDVGNEQDGVVEAADRRRDSQVRATAGRDRLAATLPTRRRPGRRTLTLRDRPLVASNRPLTDCPPPLGARPDRTPRDGPAPAPSVREIP